MAKLRAVSKTSMVSHSVPTAGERLNEKTSNGYRRVMPGGTWTTIALCGAKTEHGREVKLDVKGTSACKKCLRIIDRIYAE